MSTRSGYGNRPLNSEKNFFYHPKMNTHVHMKPKCFKHPHERFNFAIFDLRKMKKQIFHKFGKLQVPQAEMPDRVPSLDMLSSGTDNARTGRS